MKKYQHKLNEEAHALLKQKRQELVETRQILEGDLTDSAVICYLAVYHTQHCPRVVMDGSMSDE